MHCSDGSICFHQAWLTVIVVCLHLSSEEIINLRNLKPTFGERRNAVSIPDRLDTPAKPDGGTSEDSAASKSEEAEDGSAAGDAESKNTEGASTADSKDDLPATEGREAAAKDENDDDSIEAVGKEEAAEQDQDMMDEGDNSETIEPVDPSNADRVTSMFQKILSLGGTAASGQVVVKIDEDEASGQAGK
jgi:hypothetical protein